MYHPELYPDLAKNNYKGEKLKNLTELKIFEKMQKTIQLKEKKSLIKEHQIVTKFVPSRNSGDLKGIIKKFSIKSKSLSNEHYTSRYEIEPMIEDMKSIAKQFFVPNLEIHKNNIIDKVVRESIAEKRNEILSNEATPIDEITCNSNFCKPDSFNTINYDYIVQLYKSAVESNKPVDLQELLLDMKSQGYINPHTNIQINPSYPNINENQRVYLDENIAMKLEYEDLLRKIKDFSDDEITSMLTHYHLDTREELEKEIEKEISILNEEIMMKYLQLKNDEI